MKRKLVLLLSVLFILSASSCLAQLDLEQEVLVIPDTHDSEQYKWKKARNTRDYKVRMDHSPLIAGNATEFNFTVTTKTPKTINGMHVFITDKGLNAFRHISPESETGRYRFIFNAPSQGKYRFEFVFKTSEDGWINLSEDVSIKEGVEKDMLQEQDKDYSVNVKLFPEKVYAEHVVTFLYEISHNGSPVKYPEEMEGADILLASWDKSRREFVCAGSRQNVDGQIAVSVVFMKPGTHRVFAEFRHNGKVRIFSHTVEVRDEALIDRGTFTDEDRSTYY
ncbi:MAG: hypothetical protein C4538_03950 [Nitrospiraceae bacterium]|nr:MAG: hypothetical protein C4538_03950 [Nitrospiraceae bacterium]